MYRLNRRIPNGTYGGVRGEKFIKNYPLLDFSYSSVRNDYGVQALAPTITLEFYLMSFHFIQKENLIQENKALSLK